GSSRRSPEFWRRETDAIFATFPSRPPRPVSKKATEHGARRRVAGLCRSCRRTKNEGGNGARRGAPRSSRGGGKRGSRERQGQRGRLGIDRRNHLAGHSLRIAHAA